MKKITKILLLIFFGLVMFTLSVNTLKVEAKYNVVELRDNSSMNLRLEKGKTVIDFLDDNSKANTFAVGNYDMYAIHNEEGLVRYYIVDIFNDQVYLKSKIDTLVLKVMIYNKNSLVFNSKDIIYLEIVYYNTKTGNISYKEMILENSDFAILTRHSKAHNLSDDELSDRLRASQNAETVLKANALPKYNLNMIGLMSTTTSYANANHTVSAYHHDSYTNSDYWKDIYTNPDIFNSNYVNYRYTDDVITKVVPKHLFFTEGVHSYVGKEYGFSVKTIKQSSTIYVADVFVYDINVYKPLDYKYMFDYAVAEVSPNYQFRYSGVKKGSTPSSTWNLLYDSSLTEVVVKHTAYDSPNYYIKDVQVKFTTRNLLKSNPGMAGYNVRDDYGDNVVDAQFYYNGEGKTTGRNNYDLSNIKYSIERHTYMTNSGNDPLLSGNVVLTHNNSSTVMLQGPTFHNVLFKEMFFQVPYDRATSIHLDNMLYKSITINKRTSTVLNNQNPLLLGTRTANNFIRAIAIYENREREYVNENQLHVSIALDFVSDDTMYIFAIPVGQITVLDTAEGSYYYGNYHRKPYVIGFHTRPNSFNLNITTPGETIYIGFMPVYESFYNFQTQGNMDTVTELYSLDHRRTLEINDDGGSGFNSSISFISAKDEFYLFKVRLYNSNLTGSFTVKLNQHPFTTIYSPGVYSYSMIMECTPIKVWVPKTSTYRFFAIGYYNTIVRVYTDDGTLLGISYNHPEQVGNNTVIDINLQGGRYYIISIWTWTYNENSTLYYAYLDLNP